MAATPEPGRSYELWLVSDRFPQPRSLGLVGEQEYTVRPTLASFDPDTIRRATYAVSLEPQGGSPTGVPTGPVLFGGELIEVSPR
jgi:anti-sigma-K factor RskA